MKLFATRFASAAAAAVLGIAALALPARMYAQATGSMHGHVTNPAGIPITKGDVRLTTDKTPGNVQRKYDYTFPLDGSGNYKGDGIKPANYIAVVYQDGKTIDFIQNLTIAGGEDKLADFDMTRKEYLDKMSAEDRAALEDFKKKNAETVANNGKIANLNAMLKTARDATKAGDYATAEKAMSDATTAKPDEAILWDTLGDAQLGDATAAEKAAKAAKTTDATVPDKYSAAIASYQKALTLNAANAKPSAELTATVDNQLGQALGKTGKPKESAAAYEAAAKADPPKAGMYYFNEAATMFNASDMEDAAAAADKALVADPNKAEAYYIKAQALIQKASVDKAGKITAPPGCVEAYQKYLELAPTGSHADEVKGILTGIGEPIKASYKAGKK